MKVTPYVPAFVLPQHELPAGFVYPTEYVAFYSDHGSSWRLNTWGFFQAEHLLPRYKGMKARYPARTLIPIARCWDNDDVACFEFSPSSGSSKLVLVHDYASAGWEHRGQFASIQEWLGLVDLWEQEWLQR